MYNTCHRFTVDEAPCCFAATVASDDGLWRRVGRIPVYDRQLGFDCDIGWCSEACGEDAVAAGHPFAVEGTTIVLIDGDIDP